MFLSLIISVMTRLFNGTIELFQIILIKASSDSPELLKAPAVLSTGVCESQWDYYGVGWNKTPTHLHPPHTHSFTPIYFNYSVTHLPSHKMKFVPLMPIKSMSVNLWSAGWIIRAANWDQAATFNLLWHWHDITNYRLISNVGAWESDVLECFCLAIKTLETLSCVIRCIF